jgi:flagellin
MTSMINTNVNSLTAQRQLGESQNDLSTAMARLSSGLRINSAKDDAAGLAISERFTAQIRGTNQAQRNANDGISLAQTAEGDLAQISNNLQRIRELAVQSANATNSASDRVSLNNEATALIVENDRVASTSSFNGIKLLDGTFTAQNFQVGANGTSNDVVAVSSIASARSNSLGVGASSSYSTVANGGNLNKAVGLASGQLSLNGVAVGASQTDGVSSSYALSSGIALAAAINAISGNSNVNATVSATVVPGQSVTISFTTALAAGAVTINGVDIGALSATTTGVGRGAQVAAAINLKTSQTGVTAVADTTNGAVSLTAADGRNIIVAGTTGANASVGLGAGGTSYGNLTAGGGITLAAATTSLAAGTIFINGLDVGAIAAGISITDKVNKIVAAINAVTARTGVTAIKFTAGTISLAGGVYSNSSTDNTLTGTVGATLTGLAIGGGPGAIQLATPTTGLQAVSRSTVSLTSSSATGINLATNDIGAAAGGVTKFTGLTTAFTAATTTAGAGVSSINLTTATGAQAALAAVDSAINTVNSTRAALGAYQARFMSVVASLATTAENLTASRSRVQDADFAAETAALSRAQILQQAGTAMVAQANQLPQGVLALLRQ